MRSKNRKRRTYDQKRKGRRSYEQTINRSTAITRTEYTGLQKAYDHLNRTLFDRTLGDVFITYQRRAHSRGYFSPDRFSGRVDESGQHELALNPDHFISRTDEEICSTLAHEMAHVWQHQHGEPSSRGYHNKEWAAKMKAIGLQPSNTGAVGGKETGQQMTHYIIADGPFQRAFQKLAATGWKLNLQSAQGPGPEGRRRRNKTTFSCPDCGQNAFDKPGLAIICKPCVLEVLRGSSIAEGVVALIERHQMPAVPAGPV